MAGLNIFERRERRWLGELLSRLRNDLGQAAALSLFTNVLALGIPIFTLQVYDRVVFYSGLSTLYALISGMVLVIGFDFVIRQARARQLRTIALQIDAEVGRSLFDSFLRSPLRELERRPFDYWLSLFRDVDVIRNGLSGHTFVLLSDLPFAVLFFVLIAVVAQPIAWVLFAALPVLGLVAWRSATMSGQRQGAGRGSAAERDRFLTELLGGRTTLKTLALDEHFRSAWDRRHADTIRSAMARGAQSDSFSNLTSALGIALATAITAAGAIAILEQRMTIGSLIAANILSAKIVGPLTSLVSNWRSYVSLLQAIDRVGAALCLPKERATATILHERPKGRIAVEGVAFAYERDAPPALRGVSLVFEPGQVYGVLGANGSGKTTLLKLLCGLYRPDQGRVLIDGADLAQFTRGQMSGWIGYLPQEPMLLDASIRENVAAGREADDAEVVRVARLVGLHDHVVALPDGYAAQVGEAGRQLSGGVRQRIALARALVGSPPVILLDEPASYLDPRGEQELRKALAELAGSHTVILVNHGPALIAACTQLVVLNQGRTVGWGPTREVLRRLQAPARAPAPRRLAETA